MQMVEKLKDLSGDSLPELLQSGSMSVVKSVEQIIAACNLQVEYGVKSDIQEVCSHLEYDTDLDSEQPGVDSEVALEGQQQLCSNSARDVQKTTVRQNCPRFFALFSLFSFFSQEKRMTDNSAFSKE